MFSPQNLDDALRDLSAAMHRDLSEKQALCYSLSFPPTKLELCTTRPEGTDSFIFEFPHPDARLGFEQAFDEAKRKLGKPGPKLRTFVLNLKLVRSRQSL